MPSARIRKKGSGCLSRNICSLCIGTYDALLWRTPMPRTLRGETFIRVYRSFSSLRDTKAFAAWIYRIATNEAMRIVESKKKRRHRHRLTCRHARRRQLCRLFRRRGRQVAKCHTEAAAQTASGVQPSVLQRDGLRRHCESG